MDKNTGYVKGQKVITPSGEGFISEATGDRITVKLDSGETETFAEEDIEDNSDAG
jgi:preprotein translocase subunit YajC